MISIIIPAHNGEKYIANALSSIISNKDVVDEVIVSLDHTTDRTEEIAHNFDTILPMEYVKVPEKLPRGPGNARQAGLDVATGEWVTFIDVDDQFVSMSLQEVEKGLKTIGENRPDIPLAIAHFVELDYKTKKAGVVHKEDRVWVHGKFYKRDFLRKHNIRFHENLYTHEDIYFNSFVFNYIADDETNYAIIDNTVYYWIQNQNPDSMTSSDRYTEDNFDDYLYATMEPSLHFLGTHGEMAHDQIMANYGMGFLYYQNFLYHYGKGINPIVKKTLDAYTKTIINTLKIKDVDDFLSRINPGSYSAARSTICATHKPFIETESIKDYLKGAF